MISWSLDPLRLERNEMEPRLSSSSSSLSETRPVLSISLQLSTNYLYNCIIGSIGSMLDITLDITPIIKNSLLYNSHNNILTDTLSYIFKKKI